MVSKTKYGPAMAYSSSSGGWPSGVPQWMSYELKSTEYRKKPVGSLLRLLPTSHTRRKTFQTVAYQTYSTSGGYWSKGPAEFRPAPINFPNEDYQSGRKAAVMKLREKIKGEEWNVSTFMGELPETLKYFGQTLSTILRSYRAVRRGDMRMIRNIRKPRRETRRPMDLHWMTRDMRVSSRWGANLSGTVSTELSSRWMEWRYAITPMMYDLDDMLKVLYNKRVQLYYRRAVAGVNLSYSASRIVESSPSSDNVAHEVARNTIRLGAYFRVNPKIDDWKKLGLLNPVATLWELTPLSFVFDWFLPVGDYLSSLDALAGVSLASTWESQRVRAVVTTSGYQHYASNGMPDPYLSWYRTEVGGSSATTDDYYRLPFADLSLPLPEFGLGLNAKRLLDAISLARLSRKS